MEMGGGKEDQGGRWVMDAIEPKKAGEEFLLGVL